MSAGGHQQFAATVPDMEETAWYQPAGMSNASPTSTTTVQAAGCRAASADDAEQWCGEADHAGSAPKSAPDEGGTNSTVLRPLNTVRILWLSSQCGAEDVGPGESHRFNVPDPASQGGIGLRFDDMTRSASAWRVSFPSEVMAYNGACAR